MSNSIQPDVEGSFLGGGEDNEIAAGAHHAVISGGSGNVILYADDAVIAGGNQNMIGSVAGVMTFGATISGGARNHIHSEAFDAVIAGGFANIIYPNGTHAVISGGVRNTASAMSSSISGGVGNAIQPDAAFATIPGGAEALARSYGQQAYASGTFAAEIFSTPGLAQASLYVLRNWTTNATATELFLDGAGERVAIPRGSTWTYEILVVARSQDGGEFDTSRTAGFRLWGIINHDGAGVFLLSNRSETLYAFDPSWSASAVADNVNQALAVNVVGSATPLRWVATVRTAEVMWPQ